MNKGFSYESLGINKMVLGMGRSGGVILQLAKDPTDHATFPTPTSIDK